MRWNGQYNRDVYKYCAGYQYGDNTIVGFSHTHFSGTGHSDLGDILIMPTTGALQLNPGTADAPETGYRSRFCHDNEKASPGYYSVKLDDHDILAETDRNNPYGCPPVYLQLTEVMHISFSIWCTASTIMTTKMSGHSSGSRMTHSLPVSGRRADGHEPGPSTLPSPSRSRLSHTAL
ncbi:MAG: hypothetical protein MZV63_43465 [Marinilabiliales bacterium]|nr:hypothetical protein [Marinilabiliales bacterium]